MVRNCDTNLSLIILFMFSPGLIFVQHPEAYYSLSSGNNEVTVKRYV